MSLTLSLFILASAATSSDTPQQHVHLNSPLLPKDACEPVHHHTYEFPTSSITGSIVDTVLQMRSVRIDAAWKRVDAALGVALFVDDRIGSQAQETELA